MTGIQKIRIKLKAYDPIIIDQSVRDIIMAVKRVGGKVSGPIPLPTERTVYTVLRSPHVDKKSREQFELKIHKRLIDIVDETNQVADSLQRMNLPAGVGVEIKLG